MSAPFLYRKKIYTGGRIFSVQYCKNVQPYCAFLIPPAPETGATMYNPIVNTLFKVCVNKGWSVIRFNFSQDRSYKIDPKQSMHTDINCILDWYAGQITEKQCMVVAGYGSGGLMSLETLMRRPELRGFVSIGTQGQVNSNAFMAPCPYPGLFIHGRFDQYALLGKVQEIVKKLQLQQSDIKLQILDDDHFFTKYKNDVLKDCIDEYLEEVMDRDNEILEKDDSFDEVEENDDAEEDFGDEDDSDDEN